VSRTEQAPREYGTDNQELFHGARDPNPQNPVASLAGRVVMPDESGDLTIGSALYFAKDNYAIELFPFRSVN